MKRERFKKGDIYISPINYRKKDGRKVGVHNVIIRRNKEGDFCDTKLITHSRINSHKLDKRNIIGNTDFIDNKSFITKDNFKSLKKYMRKRKAKYRLWKEK